ncbi:glucokinase [Methylophilaceae bacterium]|nr:glucokinase [Methylophilaceae bacterium]
MGLHIGVDIGGTNLRVGVIDGLAVIHETRVHADFSLICKSNPPRLAWQEILRITCEALMPALQAYPAAVSIGIGFPGFIDPESGMIAQSPNLPGLRNVDLAGDLSPLIGRRVVIENDALAAAYGEYRLHPDSGRHLIYLGLGTGVGGGLILNGKPHAGQHGVAMEVGHLVVEPDGRLCGCGNRGCMEQYASASGVSITYHERAGRQCDADVIAGLAASGDEDAIFAYALAANTLAQALAHILKVVDVREVVIGGGMCKAWPLMEGAFNQRLQKDLIPVLRGRVRVAVSGTADHAGIIGAALLAAGH